MVLRAERLGYAVIGVVFVGLVAGLAWYWIGQYEAAKTRYADNAEARTAFVARDVETAFSSIYQNIRTLALLPSIQSIDRHGETLSEEARTTYQQVYNNLASNVDVSEVYVLPADFDPEKVDPVTGEGEAPIIAFDQLIVNAGRGAAADAAGGDPAAANAPEEVEIYEYRLLKKQIAWFKANYPTASSIKGMAYPMIGGPEVITCDNRTYITTLDDNDRSGLVLTVPFYRPDGTLGGAVAAIMLTNAYQALLPGGDYGLINTAYGYATRPDGQAGASRDFMLKGRPDPSLIYSEAVPITTADPNGGWMLWAGHPNAQFFGSAEAGNLLVTSLASLLAVLLLAGAATVICFFMGRSIKRAASDSLELENKVAARTAEISQLAARAEAAASINADWAAQAETLRTEMARVVDSAIAGNFSARVDAGVADKRLDDLGRAVNELLATIDTGLGEATDVMASLARTDLRERMTGEYSGALAQLETDTNLVADTLADVVRRLRQASASVKSATAEILAGTNDLAARTNVQVTWLDTTRSAVDDLDRATNEIAQRASAANQRTQRVAETADETGSLMTRANDAVEQISTSSERISNIIGLIDDIAFQTNLLALNASVEAARAGEMGKGFAVVAVEVRRLAQSAAEASSQVKALIEQSATEVANGYRLVTDATRSLQAMVGDIAENRDIIGAIAAATQDQTRTLSDLGKAVRQVEEMTRSNAALVEQTNSALAETEAQARELDRMVEVFILPDDDAVDLRRGRRRLAGVA